MNIARPSEEIDLVTKKGDARSEPGNTQEAGTHIPQPAAAASIRLNNTGLGQPAAVVAAGGPVSNSSSTSARPTAMFDKYASSKKSLGDGDEAHFSGDSDNDFDNYEGRYDLERST